jgi:antitoxin component YwqK of YwqJK toxin-antitoxin module
MKIFKIVLALLVAASFASCGGDESANVEKPKNEKPADLVVIENGLYTEYYPGKKHIKFQGQQDEFKQRHGRWTFYSESGLELSITHYMQGIKHGHSIVKDPNGNLNYIGEYDNGKEIGVWKMYDEKGVKTETDYSNINQ